MTKIVPTNQIYQVDSAYKPDKEVTWKYPAEQDGWVHAHNSLRGEISEIKAALQAIVSRGGASSPGKLTQEWQVRALKEAIHCHIEHITAHHTNEDKLLMPELRKRFNCPEKFEADHEEIVAMIDTINNMASQLRVNSSVEALLAQVVSYEALVRPHLLEEEETALLLMRAYFEPQEIAVIVQQILQHGPTVEMGSFIYFMGVDEFRKTFMKQEGIPFFVWYLALQSRYRYFVKHFVRNVEALKTDKEPASMNKRRRWFS